MLGKEWGAGRVLVSQAILRRGGRVDWVVAEPGGTSFFFLTEEAPEDKGQAGWAASLASGGRACVVPSWGLASSLCWRSMHPPRAFPSLGTYLSSLCAHVPLCWKGVEVDSRSSVHCHGCLAVQFQAATTPVGTGWVMRGASRGRGAQRRRHNSRAIVVNTRRDSSSHHVLGTNQSAETYTPKDVAEYLPALAPQVPNMVRFTLCCQLDGLCLQQSNAPANLVADDAPPLQTCHAMP